MPEEKKTAVKFIPLKAEFEDFYEQPVNLEFEFQKPTTSQIERTNKTLQKAGLAGCRNLLLWVVNPEQKTALIGAMDEYPGIVQTFADAIYLKLGFGSLGK